MEEPHYFYKDARLWMTPAGRFFVRLITFLMGGLIVAFISVSILSEILAVQALAILLILYLLERGLHFGKSEYRFTHHDQKTRTQLPSLGLYRYNVASYTPPLTYRIVERALTRSCATGGNFYLHLLKALVAQKLIAGVLIRLEISPKEFEAKLDEYLAKSEIKKTKAENLVLLESVMLQAFTRAITHYGEMVLPRDLFGALAEIEDEELHKLFALFQVTKADIDSAFLFASRKTTGLHLFAQRRFSGRVRSVNRSWTSRPTPFLDKYSTDVTASVRNGGGFLVGHKEEYDRLVAVLSRPGSNRALLIGQPGAGKSTIVEHLAFSISRDIVPEILFDKRLVSLSISGLVAGASEIEIQERIARVLDEIIRAGNVVLFIPDIHLLLKTSGSSISGADVLLPAISSGAFSVIGGTFPKEYARDVEPNYEFARTFEAIRIEEISPDDAVRYLVYAAMVLETQMKTVISFGAIKEAVFVAHGYFKETLLPSSAENILKEAVTEVTAAGKKLVTKRDVVAIAERKTNVIIHKAEKEEIEELLNLEDIVHQRFIDQEQAVTAVADALRQYRSGLSRKGGPIASFLFVGPTGVGKTELAKLITEIQFGSAEVMARFDMSEYQDQKSLQRLIGAPDGSSAGAMTEAVRTTPYRLLLLDEFEKAHPDIVNIFLQVLDDGRLTDGFGRTTDFQNTIIIATSNAHSALIQQRIGEGVGIGDLGVELRTKLVDYFKPELINRFSEVVVFKNLSPEDVVAIARLNLAGLMETFKETQGAELVIEESAILAIARLGYEPAYGARPLRRVISEQLRSVLAEKVLRGEVTRGGSVRVLYRDEQFVIE